MSLHLVGGGLLRGRWAPVWGRPGLCPVWTPAGWPQPRNQPPAESLPSRQPPKGRHAVTPPASTRPTLGSRSLLRLRDALQGPLEAPAGVAHKGGHLAPRCPSEQDDVGLLPVLHADICPRVPATACDQCGFNYFLSPSRFLWANFVLLVLTRPGGDSSMCPLS